MFPPIFSSFFCFPPFFCQLWRCIVFKICWIEVHCHWQRLEIERHQQPASGAGGSLTDRRFDVNEIHAIVTVQSFLLLHKWPNFSRYDYYDNCPNGSSSRKMDHLANKNSRERRADKKAERLERHSEQTMEKEAKPMPCLAQKITHFCLLLSITQLCRSAPLSLQTQLVIVRVESLVSVLKALTFPLKATFFFFIHLC